MEKHTEKNTFVEFFCACVHSASNVIDNIYHHHTTYTLIFSALFMYIVVH